MTSPGKLGERPPTGPAESVNFQAVGFPLRAVRRSPTHRKSGTIQAVASLSARDSVAGSAANSGSGRPRVSWNTCGLPLSNLRQHD